MSYPPEIVAVHGPVDVGIITIVSVEVDALFSALGVLRDRYESAESPLQYWRTSYRSSSSGRDLSIVVSILGGEAGNTEAAIATAHFLQDWHPRLMCLVGIAAGITGSSHIGDVLMPNKVHDRTIKVFRDGRYRVRGQTYSRNETLERMLKVAPPTDAALQSAIQACASADFAAISQRDLPIDQFDGHVRFRDGSITSDNVLIRDPAYFDGVLEATDEKCRGGEMEAAGFVRACQKERPDFPWLVVRGVSDFGDSNKDDAFQMFAAKGACAALKLFIEHTLAIDALPPNPRATRSKSALELALAEEVRTAFAAKKWREVCKIGFVISRPLWLSGNVALRYELGLLIESAAALCDNARLRARALIDDLGWSAIALGQPTQGEKHIAEGMRYAVDCGDNYSIAKGYRHLASLNRRSGNLDAAASLLSKARSAADHIADGHEKREIISSLEASTAKLRIAQGDYPDGMVLLRDALQRFHDAGDAEREAKIYDLLSKYATKLKE